MRYTNPRLLYFTYFNKCTCLCKILTISVIIQQHS